MLIIQENLANTHRGSLMGLLIMHSVVNLSFHENLYTVKLQLIDSLRQKYNKFTRKELKSTHPLNVYVSYYKRFGHNYHVLLQLESIIAQGKSLPRVCTLVEAMFMAELKNMLLTAGHDLEKVVFPLCFKTSSQKENYTGLSGRELQTVPEDMMLADSEGIISSIMRGPDLRTSITPATRQILFTVYAPPGITEDLVYQHLDDIECYVRIFSNEAVTQTKKVYGVEAK